MNSIFSKPLVVTIVALILAAIAGFVVVPGIGNPPVVPASLQVQAGAPQEAPGGTVTVGTPVQLGFPIPGRVGSVNVSVGDSVKEGDILATLDLAMASTSVAQAKAALELAQAQYGSVNLQYANAKTQQDTLVENAYETLLSSGLEARPIGTTDETHSPTVSGTYSCSKTGSYEIDTYASGAASNYSFNVSGLENGNGVVTYGTPQPLGSCGLYITFQSGFSGGSKWSIDIPNTDSSAYQASKNAYDLAVATRDQTLSQLAATIGQDGSAPGAATASAAITVAQAAYDAAQAAYNNNLIVAPADGTVSFIDVSLKVGQSVSAGQRVLTITTK